MRFFSFSRPPVLTAFCCACACVGATGLMLALSPQSTRAQTLNTVTWSSDNNPDGLGAGVLALPGGGNAIVTYSSAAGTMAGTTIADNWNTSLATGIAVGSGVSNMTAGVFGVPTTLQVQTLSFSSGVTNPLLLFNYADAGTSLNFTGLSYTLLSSSNAQKSGSVMTFIGATGGFNDGFAARFNGTFTSLVFTSSSTSNAFQSLPFTVGVFNTPEPSTLSLLGMGLVTAFGAGTVGAVRRRAGQGSSLDGLPRCKSEGRSTKGNVER